MIDFFLKNKFYLLVAFILILYGNTIFYGYIWDDFDLVITTPSDIIQYTIASYLIRPIMFLSYFITNYFFNSSIFDHSVNITLFVIAAKLAFDFTTKTHDKFTAFFIILLWISLPWISHPIIWISQRNDTLMIIFSFLALKSDKNEKVFKSSIFLVLSILSLFVYGLNFGIDFRGGILMEVRSEKNVAISEIRTELETLKLGEINIQRFGKDTDTPHDEVINENIRFKIEMPFIDELLNPFLLTIPLQLLAYHVALLKKCDIDKPRNLAKSVTVE